MYTPTSIFPARGCQKAKLITPFGQFELAFFVRKAASSQLPTISLLDNRIQSKPNQTLTKHRTHQPNTKQNQIKFIQV